MKLKFERYPGMSCFYVRGLVEPDKLKILLFGLDALLKDQEEPIIIHLANAILSAQEIQVLAGMKKKLTAYKVQQHWVHADRTVGEYKTFDLLASRAFNSKNRYIADRIKLDDEVYVLNEKITTTQEEISKLGGSEESVQKIILENDILKAQKEVLDHSLAAQHARMPHQKMIPSEDPEIANNTTAALAELVKVAAGEVPL